MRYLALWKRIIIIRDFSPPLVGEFDNFVASFTIEKYWFGPHNQSSRRMVYVCMPALLPQVSIAPRE